MYNCFHMAAIYTGFFLFKLYIIDASIYKCKSLSCLLILKFSCSEQDSTSGTLSLGAMRFSTMRTVRRIKRIFLWSKYKFLTYTRSNQDLDAIFENRIGMSIGIASRIATSFRGCVMSHLYWSPVQYYLQSYDKGTLHDTVRLTFFF